jgi:hypothetical protein
MTACAYPMPAHRVGSPVPAAILMPPVRHALRARLVRRERTVDATHDDGAVFVR